MVRFPAGQGAGIRDVLLPPGGSLAYRETLLAYLATRGAASRVLIMVVSMIFPAAGPFPPRSRITPGPRKTTFCRAVTKVQGAQVCDGLAFQAAGVDATSRSASELASAPAATGLSRAGRSGPAGQSSGHRRTAGPAPRFHGRSTADPNQGELAPRRTRRRRRPGRSPSGRPGPPPSTGRGPRPAVVLARAVAPDGQADLNPRLLRPLPPPHRDILPQSPPRGLRRSGPLGRTGPAEVPTLVAAISAGPRRPHGRVGTITVITMPPARSATSWPRGPRRTTGEEAT